MHDALGSVQAKWPGWECWQGVGGLVYARRLRTRHASPIAMVRAETPDYLDLKISVAEAALTARDVIERAGEGGTSLMLRKLLDAERANRPEGGTTGRFASLPA